MSLWGDIKLWQCWKELLKCSKVRVSLPSLLTGYQGEGTEVLLQAGVTKKEPVAGPLLPVQFSVHETQTCHYTALPACLGTFTSNLLGLARPWAMFLTYSEGLTTWKLGLWSKCPQQTRGTSSLVLDTPRPPQSPPSQMVWFLIFPFLFPTPSCFATYLKLYDTIWC